MCCYHLRIHSVSLSCVFSLHLFLPLASLLSIAFLLSLSPSSALSPHLMRPHNNTAVVQLFCYLSQTAGLLHSVFLVPFTCLLRQGNEYHLEQQSTPKKERAVWRLGLHLKVKFCRHCLAFNQIISNTHDLCVDQIKWPDKEDHMFGGCRTWLWIPARLPLEHIVGHQRSNKTVCSHGDRADFGTAAFGVIPCHSLISDDCSKWQTLLFFFFPYCFNCVPPLAKPGMCKPGLRSERERITPPVDWSTVGNAQGGDWVNTSPSSTYQWTSRQNAALLSFLTAAYSDLKKKKENKTKLRRIFSTSTHDNSRLIDCVHLWLCVATVFLESGEDHGLFAWNIDIILQCFN